MKAWRKVKRGLSKGDGVEENCSNELLRVERYRAMVGVQGGTCGQGCM